MVARTKTTGWWRNVGLAAIAGGLAMAAYMAFSSMILGNGPWWPANLVAASLPGMYPPTPGFSPSALLAGFSLHMLTSLAWGLAYGFLVLTLANRTLPRLPRSWLFASTIGLGWGLFTWLVMGLAIGPRVDPMITLADQTQFLAGHLIFGVVTALTLTALVRRTRPRVTFAPGVPAEAPLSRR